MGLCLQGNLSICRLNIDGVQSHAEILGKDCGDRELTGRRKSVGRDPDQPDISTVWAPDTMEEIVGQKHHDLNLMCQCGKCKDLLKLQAGEIANMVRAMGPKVVSELIYIRRQYIRGELN